LGATLAVLTAVATLGLCELTVSPAGAVTGPTTTLRFNHLGALHFTPKAMTVPDIGPSTCSSSNYSFSVVNQTSKGIWLSLDGQETWFVVANSPGSDFCFSAPFANPLVFSVLNSKGHPIPRSRTLTLTVT
jgi:hypothetical protein